MRRCSMAIILTAQDYSQNASMTVSYLDATSVLHCILSCRCCIASWFLSSVRLLCVWFQHSISYAGSVAGQCWPGRSWSSNESWLSAVRQDQNWSKSGGPTEGGEVQWNPWEVWWGCLELQLLVSHSLISAWRHNVFSQLWQNCHDHVVAFNCLSCILST